MRMRVGLRNYMVTTLLLMAFLALSCALLLLGHPRMTFLGLQPPGAYWVMKIAGTVLLIGTAVKALQRFLGHYLIHVTEHELVLQRNVLFSKRTSRFLLSEVEDVELLRNVKTNYYIQWIRSTLFSFHGFSLVHSPEWARTYVRIPAVVAFRVKGREERIGMDLQDFDASALFTAIRKAKAGHRP